MKEIPIYKGRDAVAYAKVDDDDFEWVSSRRWVLSQYGYAVRYPSIREDGFNRTVIFMHREILGLAVGDGSHTDHINRDRLDNRRVNLRVCSIAENNRNVSGHGKSEHRGVSYRPQISKSKPWIATVARKHLGTFATEMEAALAAATYRREIWPQAYEPLLEMRTPAQGRRRGATTTPQSRR